MIETKAGVALPAMTQVVPEGVDALVAMQMTGSHRSSPGATSFAYAARLSGCTRASSSQDDVG